jgi:hypothetical protein
VDRLLMVRRVGPLSMRDVAVEPSRADSERPREVVEVRR